MVTTRGTMDCVPLNFGREIATSPRARICEGKFPGFVRLPRLWASDWWVQIKKRGFFISPHEIRDLHEVEIDIGKELVPHFISAATIANVPKWK